MKKLICILMLSLMLVGCGERSELNIVTEENSRFICVEDHIDWKVIVDKDTGVMYIMSCGVHNTGTFTHMVDVDGNPLIFKGVMK